ncbi:hypothetical protein T265_10527 [Opisthorchis viverrini]|uniref:Uncharacterized protein n=1 Tax=Opisthorchis viverrini TaxID=6198 RepID=A0A074Z1Y4_OPIVI|nr:hypothetical protein T265_10527 [Opisthorchis viverrini]KER21056.1 hypothetical protein T265_10527 [Opisthorchis viverrini]
MSEDPDKHPFAIRGLAGFKFIQLQDQQFALFQQQMSFQMKTHNIITKTMKAIGHTASTHQNFITRKIDRTITGSSFDGSGTPITSLMCEHVRGSKPGTPVGYALLMSSIAIGHTASTHKNFITRKIDRTITGSSFDGSGTPITSLMCEHVRGSKPGTPVGYALLMSPNKSETRVQCCPSVWTGVRCFYQNLTVFHNALLIRFLKLLRQPTIGFALLEAHQVGAIRQREIQLGSRLGQAGSIQALVLPSRGMTARYRKCVTAVRYNN